jgi:hypothetical protein
MIRILFLGDIVGSPGRKMVKKRLGELKDIHKTDIVIANGENSAGGLGITPQTAGEIFSAGVDVITLGNHTWKKKEILPYLDKESHRIIRPENYPNAPGKGWAVVEIKDGIKIGVANIHARVFIDELLDCPFQAIDKIISEQFTEADISLVDFHGEATSEKIALGYYLDSKVSAVVGTHTHVQTADARVLEKGTAYITDVGMCGPVNGVIGVDKAPIIERFITSRPNRFEVAKGPSQLNAVIIDVDESTSKAIAIERIYEVES